MSSRSWQKMGLKSIFLLFLACVAVVLSLFWLMGEAIYKWARGVPQFLKDAWKMG